MNKECRPQHAPARHLEEQPYLYTERDEKFIYFRTNIPPNAERFDSFYLTGRTTDTWVYYPLSLHAQGLLNSILSHQRVPLQAEGMLAQIFEGLKLHVTIISDISGSTTIEEKILRLHHTKQSLADSLLEGIDTTHASPPKTSSICWGRGYKISIIQDGQSYRRAQRNLMLIRYWQENISSQQYKSQASRYSTMLDGNVLLRQNVMKCLVLTEIWRFLST